MRVVNRMRESEQRLAHGHVPRCVGALRGRVLVIQDGYSHNPLRCCVAQVGGLQLCGQLTFPFVSAVLKPDFDLGLCEVKGGSKARALRAAEVAFHVEGGLQLEHLTPRKHRASFLFPARFLVRAVVVLLPVVHAAFFFTIFDIALFEDNLVTTFVVVFIVFGVRV